jgi:hypothetical protein
MPYGVVAVCVRYRSCFLVNFGFFGNEEEFNERRGGNDQVGLV